MASHRIRGVSPVELVQWFNIWLMCLTNLSHAYTEEIRSITVCAYVYRETHIRLSMATRRDWYQM